MPSSRTARPRNAAQPSSASSRSTKPSRPAAPRKPTLERLITNAPASPTAAQFRVLLRAIIHLDPYSFADDLAEEIDAEQDSNEDRSTEEVLLTALASTTDEKLTGFAIRLALTGHVGIPREDEPDSLAEATMTFVLTQELQKGGKQKLVPTPAKKKNAAKKAAKRKAA